MKHKILTLATVLALSTTLAFADINPKDGTWKPEITSNKTSGCPSMMTSMLNKQSIPTKSKNMTFSKPFHPSSLFDEAQELKWKKLGTNKWEASIVNNEGGGMNASVKWNLTVVSQTKMNVHSKVYMKFPAQMAAMFGGSSECKADTIGSFNYIGN